MKPRNCEQDVIDAIDALVDEQMAGGEQAHRQRAQAAGPGDRCALCGGAWHGEPWTGVDHEHLGRYDRHDHGRVYGCPGANATGPQRIRWRHEDRGAQWLAQHGFRTGGSPFVDQIASVAWTVDMVNAMCPPVPPWQQRLYEGIVRRHSQDIQLPTAPAFNPDSWGLPAPQPYFLVDDDGQRTDPQPSPWVILHHTDEGAAPSITHVIPPELTLRHQRPLADSPQWLQDMVDNTADWLADMLGRSTSPRWRNWWRAAVDGGSPYVGPELHEGARIAVQLADGSLVTGTIGRYDDNEETGEIEMTIVADPAPPSI
ncbi:hypothetical protein [Mycobacteroides abscessus]|uniref:hypothetical protein n=1 Tax=Mycobacteroides abscessus TaxID=36809 RepID=UPI00092C9F25|nr:hypothetical protein [Mycobacteroides abscessus]SHP53561.1 Uncharacterised protein [Mycobacteroides abscessus subsp. abscessus]